MKVAIIGAGWAGLAAAVSTTQAGHHTIIFEASHALGGRARGLKDLQKSSPSNSAFTPSLPSELLNLLEPLDNGQHILIGAYTDTLRLLRTVGVQPNQVLHQLPMTLRFPSGQGLQFGRWPTPLDALTGILGARGWSLRDRAVLLRTALGWRLRGFSCPASMTVAQLCRPLTSKVVQELIEPLCVSALNTPADCASAAVFLRVLQDALFGLPGGSRLLLPKVNLSDLFPAPAAAWLTQRGAQLRMGCRVQRLERCAAGWQLVVQTADAETRGGEALEGEIFDAVILANSASNMALTLINSALAATKLISKNFLDYAKACQGLRFEAIATVYAWATHAQLAEPMLALPCSAHQPAQFVFDRGQLGGTPGLLAFVVSAAQGDRATLQAQVLAQAQAQLGLRLQAVQTVVEKRATFACTPGLQRPSMAIAPGVWACGDHVAGPYPATLEGAVRSGQAAAQALHSQQAQNF